MNTGIIHCAFENPYLTHHAIQLPYHTHPFKTIFLLLMTNCAKSEHNENVIRLVRVILCITLKTCPFNGKITRTDHRKFTHSQILLCHIPSFIWDKELQRPTSKQICDNNFGGLVSNAVRRWQHHCSQCFTCHSRKLLLLLTNTISFAFDVNHTG